MGEYATYRGENIKIGTCEDMYYLRADQRDQIQGYDFASCLDELRFRFPFPDEDDLEPGSFDDHGRGVVIPGGWKIPEDYHHTGTVQFKAEPGYLCSLPCPESGKIPEGLTIHKNGWHGGYVVKQIKHVKNEWWIVIGCKSCGDAWRLPLEEAESVAVAFRSEADRREYFGGEFQNAHQETHRKFLHTMADRILAGYSSAVAV